MHDLANRPWHEVLNKVERVNLMVAAVVIEELDKHKTGSNQRRRDRARAALRLIEEASRQATLSLTLRTAPVEVCLCISTVKPDWSSLTTLEKSNPDDRLVAEAACSPPARLLSHDAAPRIRARIAGVAVVDVPDSWLLLEEKSEDRKEIARLKAEIIRLTATLPALSLVVDRGSELEETGTFVRSIKPLREGERLAALFAASHPVPPPAPRFPYGAFDFRSVRERSLEEHRQSIADYTAKVERYFTTLHTSLNRYSRHFSIGYSVHNAGEIAVSGLRIELKVRGANLRPEPTNPAKVFRPPQPPKASSIHNQMRSLIAPHSAFGPAKTDPVAFYWIDRPTGEGQSGVLHCLDFRAAQIWTDTVDILVVAQDLPVAVSVEIEVSGTNLRAPLRESVQFNVAEQPTRWDDEWVLRTLPAEVCALVRP
jgi:rRNA-processing protein FCF1